MLATITKTRSITTVQEALIQRTSESPNPHVGDDRMCKDRCPCKGEGGSVVERGGGVAGRFRAIHEESTGLKARYREGKNNDATQGLAPFLHHGGALLLLIAFDSRTLAQNHRKAEPNKQRTESDGTMMPQPPNNDRSRRQINRPFVFTLWKPNPTDRWRGGELRPGPSICVYLPGVTTFFISDKT